MLKKVIIMVLLLGSLGWGQEYESIWTAEEMARIEQQIKELNKATIRNNRAALAIQVVSVGIMTGLAIWGYKQRTGYGTCTGIIFTLCGLSILGEK